MSLFQPGDGIAEKIGTVVAIAVSIGVLGIFAVLLSPVFGY